MKQSIKNIQPVAIAVQTLLAPFAEVVLHDVERDCICAIYNSFSRREPGDTSYLERFDFCTSSDVIGPYEKQNYDGRKLKCISLVIRGAKKKPEGLLCINLDVSHFEHAQTIIQSFLEVDTAVSAKDSELFKDDLYEQINVFVQSYCKEKNVQLRDLLRSDKQHIVHLLETEGAFRGKNAATYVGRVLGVSRATVYNYLKREEEL